MKTLAAISAAVLLSTPAVAAQHQSTVIRFTGAVNEANEAKFLKTIQKLDGKIVGFDLFITDTVYRADKSSDQVVFSNDDGEFLLNDGDYQPEKMGGADITGYFIVHSVFVNHGLFSWSLERVSDATVRLSPAKIVDRKL